ncbi:MAG: hypothetical protein J5760_07210 [Clostridia bacterium]|nr:hypothetical protein [Clostridia bacterium]
MKKELISDSVEGIDKEYIKEAAEYPAAKHSGSRIRPRVIKWIAAAACLALVISIGFVGFSIAAEAREYAAAVEFFEENGLSTEGLSREEIKAVYRDITTNSFTYGKTAEVIHKAVPGFDIDDEEPTPEELAEMWGANVLNGYRNYHDPAYGSNGAVGISYDVKCDVPAGEAPAYVSSKCVVKCMRGGETLWVRDFYDYDVYAQVYTEYGTVIAGADYYWDTGDYKSHAWLALISDEGDVVWEKRLNHADLPSERIDTLVDNRDGTFAAFGYVNYNVMTIGQYDMQGGELSFNSREGASVWNAALFGDGYLIRVGVNSVHKIDRQGNVEQSFSYESEDCVYAITDMIEFGGRVYLSAYAVPKQQEYDVFYGYGSHGEVADIMDYLFSKRRGDDEIPEISSEELTAMLREKYTALLLICDPAGGAPETFYSVRGSLGAALAVNDAGQLEWNVESIRSSFFSPMTSSFSIGGTCRVYRYTFGGDGTLIGREATGDETMFRR